MCMMKVLAMDDVKTAREILLALNVNGAVTIFSAGHHLMTVRHVTVILWAQLHYSVMQKDSAPVSQE